MFNPFSAFCDDFYVNMRLGSQLAMPDSRDAVLHFFERVQKQFPGMTRFRRNESGECNLEEDRAAHNYRWAGLEPKRLVAGHVNPVSIDEALQLHSLLLQMAPTYLGISPLEVDHLDLLLGFDLSFNGNHDEVILDSLYGGSPLACLAEEEGAAAVDVQPTITFALDECGRTQARIDVITRSNPFQSRPADYTDDVISVYLAVRRTFTDRPAVDLDAELRTMAQTADDLCVRQVVPRILRPISSAIASRS